MKFRNLTELSATLPNGLHDAELVSIAHNYATRVAEIICKLDLSSPDSVDQTGMRSARLVFSEVKFLAIDPPDPTRDYANCSSLFINSQESTPELLPSLPQYKKELGSTAIYSIYADELNGFIHIAYGSVDFEWLDGTT